MDLIAIIVDSIAAIAASASAIFAAKELKQSRITQKNIEEQNRKKATIDAFNELQEQVLDKFVSFKHEDAQIFVEYQKAYPNVKDAYNDTKALIARCEHFAVGVNEKVYDFDVVDKLGGIHLVCLFKKIRPVILFARKHSSDKNIYGEFEKMVKSLNIKYNISIEAEEEK